MDLFEEKPDINSITSALTSINQKSKEVYMYLWWLYRNECWSTTTGAVTYESWLDFFKDRVEWPVAVAAWPVQEEKLQGLSEYNKAHLKQSQIDALSVVPPTQREAVLKEARKNSRVNPLTGRKQLSARVIEGIINAKSAPAAGVVLSGKAQLKFVGKKVLLVTSSGDFEVNRDDYGILREFLEEQ
jgi:hypothetical protein